MDVNSPRRVNSVTDRQTDGRLFSFIYIDRRLFRGFNDCLVRFTKILVLYKCYTCIWSISKQVGNKSAEVAPLQSFN